MKEELQNWIKISVILSVLLVAAVQAVGLTSDTSPGAGRSQSALVMNHK